MKVSKKENRGSFIKDFTYHPKYLPGCLYQVDLIEGCGFNCAYCFLDNYLGEGDMIVYSNTGILSHELESCAGDDLNLTVTTDGAFLPAMGRGLAKLFSLIADYPQKAFEIRFKGAGVLELLKYAPPKNIYFTSTLSPKNIISSLEKGTSDLGERINCLKRFKEKGYQVGAVMDPVILHHGWRKGYQEVFDLLTGMDLKILGIGLLRLTAGMKDLFFQRVNRSQMRGELEGEFILSDDGKWRYPFQLRKSVYSDFKQMAKDIKAGKKVIYMEDPVAGKEFLS